MLSYENNEIDINCIVYIYEIHCMKYHNKLDETIISQDIFLKSFTSVNSTNISIYDYVKRFIKNSHASLECYIISMIYIERIILKYKNNNYNVNLNIYTFHRIFLLSILLAVKYHDDLYNSNYYYSKIGGIKIDELNQLEHYMLDILNYECSVDICEYMMYVNHLKRIPKEKYEHIKI